VLARTEEDLARIKTLALHGMNKDAWKRFGDEGYKHYYVVETGFKYNMMDLQAALGIHQLRRVESNWRRREKIWKTYDQAFTLLPLGLPTAPEPDTRHAYHLYTILIDEEQTGISRDEFLEAMTERGVGTGVHYLSIPEHPVYRQKFGWQPEDYHHAARIGRQTVSLPLSAKLTDAEVSIVIEAVKTALQSERHSVVGASSTRSAPYKSGKLGA
jgi:dTDP-4-amino-4,6-dideoxygalactose transaminase